MNITYFLSAMYRKFKVRLLILPIPEDFRMFCFFLLLDAAILAEFSCEVC